MPSASGLQPSDEPTRTDTGFALIAVLWALTLLSLIAAALSWETRASALIARNVASHAAARAAADAGVQRVIFNLLAYSPTAKEKFLADGTVYNWPFANHMVRISLQDELGKVNLNNAPEVILAALIAASGVDRGKAQSLADAIADFRDLDNLKRVTGAEEADYRAAGLGWGPKNAPFEQIEELRQVLGMNAEIYERVAPYLTLYSTTGVNPDLAGERLTRILRRAGFKDFVDSQGIAYSIRAEAKSSDGAVFVRKAVVGLSLLKMPPVQILSWQ
jgi:general secretion pathway protein K